MKRISISTKTVLIFINLILFIGISALYFYIQNREKTPESLLAPRITVGPLVLAVSDLASMKDFYIAAGLAVTQSDTTTMTLSNANHDVIKLILDASKRIPASVDPGLDQIALVYTSRSGLAHTMERMIKAFPSQILGTTNRGISQSLYTRDPQGNTVELYYDTDPSTWPRRNGKVMMDELPMDATQFIQQYKNESGDQGVIVGHIQLRVGDLTKAKQFYVDTMGFYIANQAIGGNSISLSDGFYHHNIGLSQIKSYDGDLVDEYLGIQGFTITLPSTRYVESLKKRLLKAQIPFTEENHRVTFTDPWGIRITIELTDTTSIFSDLVGKLFQIR